MASVEIEKQRSEIAIEERCTAKKMKQGEGLKQYYQQHIHDVQLQVRNNTHNLNRLEAQRNDRSLFAFCRNWTSTLSRRQIMLNALQKKNI